MNIPSKAARKPGELEIPHCHSCFCLLCFVPSSRMHYGPEQPRIETEVLGHLLVLSLTPLIL